MPLCLDPNQTFDIVLESDKGKTDPPTFTFRYLTGREWIKLADLVDNIESATTGSARLALIYDAVRSALVGWRNMGAHAYEPAGLEDILNPGEARELFEGAMATIQPGDAAKKA